MSRIRSGHDAVGEAEVVEAGCHGPVDSDAGSQVVGGPAGDAAVAGFETVQAAERRGNANGAAAVGTEGDGHETRGNSISGATRGTAGVVAWVVGVEGGSSVRVVVCGVCRRNIRL